MPTVYCVLTLHDMRSPSTALDARRFDGLRFVSSNRVFFAYRS